MKLNTKVDISGNVDTTEPKLNKTEEGEIFLYNYIFAFKKCVYKLHF